MVAIAAALLAACSHSPSGARGIRLTMETSPRPPRVGPVRLAFHLSDAQGKPIAGGHLKLEGDMSHPGMPPVFGDLIESQPGDYEGTLDLGMAGDWVIVLRGTLADGQIADGQVIEREVNLPGVRPD